ncbi:MAG: hypothetical protein HY514_05275 [Candidatus Aenigmarchaeota archaeon]|nr:hypothetical protein [Candidatus Aenigmarchaeota archaeon]
MNRIKGQYRIIVEIMLFGLGVAITGFVLLSFQDLQKNADEIAIKDQMSTVLNTAINAVVKASLTNNAIIRLDIPVSVSGRTYKLFVENDKNLTAIDLTDTTINVSREIFNIDEPNNRVTGDVVSSAGVAEISYSGSKIIIQRG